MTPDSERPRERRTSTCRITFYSLVEANRTRFDVGQSVNHFIFSYATASESRADRAADLEWHKRRLRRLPLHSRCRMGIASTASDGIQSNLDERRQRELESQDPRGLSRGSNRQLRLRTIIELCARLEVFCRVLEYYYVHGSELRKRDLSSARVRNFASPLWARAFLSAKTS